MKEKSANSQRRTRVVLADDHHVVRSGIRGELEKHHDIEIVGEASNGADALALAQEQQPDIIVLDINMPGFQGIEVTEKLNEIATNKKALDPSFPFPPHVLILSAYCEQEYVYSLFAAGAKGYLLKDEHPDRIVTGIRQVMRGEPALSLPVQKLLLTRRHTDDHELSIRELEVLRLMAKGHTNEEIAEELVIAIGTVKNHVTNIYRKLPNVRTRSEAVAWAWENRLVSVE